MTNAQDGLKQALEFYEKASSKVRPHSNYIELYHVVHVQEEQESARLQVQSLLSRAEELVLLLQVANTTTYTQFAMSL